MLGDLMATAMTFKNGKAEKLSFLLLNMLDLGLTLLAASMGWVELNPITRHLLEVSYQLYVIKIGIPLLLAWLLPGKLLIPAMVVLAFVIGWDIKELCVFFL